MVGPNIVGTGADNPPGGSRQGPFGRSTTATMARLFARPVSPRLAILLIFLSPPLSLDFSFESPNNSSARATVESYYRQWLELLAEEHSLARADFSAKSDALIEELFALDSLAPGALSDEWGSLTADEQAKFIGALRSSIKNKLLSYFDGNPQRVTSLTLTRDEAGDRSATLEYSIETADEQQTLTVDMLRTPDGSWRIGNVEYGNTSVLGYYHALASELLEQYSFPYLVAGLGEYPFVVLEDFESSLVGDLPVRWTWRGRDDDKRKPYRVLQEEDGNKYLQATDEGESVILGKDIKWDLSKYPYVSFRWRVHEIPEGADERFDETVDSAAGIYFVYRKVLGKIPRSVKYVWSSTLPVGSATRRDGAGKPWMIVAESGTERMGEWHTYVFDLREAYGKTFGGRPPDKPIGIGILSDANSTKSHAYADYDEIRALRTADRGVTSGVERILKANER